MNKIETIHLENRNKIKDIIIKFPELLDSNAKEKIEKEYYNILSKEKELYSLRHAVWDLEEEIRLLKAEFNLKSNLFEIEFDTEEKKVETSKCAVMIEGHGNSTLGKSNLM